MLNVLDSRTVSGFPISVGTSLALESVFEPVQETIDPSRVVPQKINITDYNEVWINVGTLFRNIYNSIDKAGSNFVTHHDYADTVEQEMNFINDLIKQNSNHLVNSVFYICNYNDLTKRFKLGTLRLPKTALQLKYSSLYKKTLEVILKRSSTGKYREVIEFESKFSCQGKEVLLVTHFPVDLLNHIKFKDLHLLESHTGVLKKKPEWHTKYYNGRDLNMLPLNGILLTVFGDDHHFSPQPLKMKNALLDLAAKRKWNCLSSNKEIVDGIKTLNDIALKDALLLQDQS